MTGKFTQDIFSTFVTQILVFLFGLIVSVMLSRQLGPEGKGIYSLVVLLPSFLVYFTSFSIGQSAIYYIGKKKYSPADIYGSTIILGIFISLFCFLVGAAVLFSHDLVFPGVEFRYLVLSLFLAPCQLFFGYLGYMLLGFQEIKKYNVFLLLQTFLFFLVAMLLFAFSAINIVNLVFGEIFVYVFVLFLVLVAVIKKTGAVKLAFSAAYAKDAFKYGSKIYFGNMFSFVNHRLNILLINFFLNPFQAGIWSVATAISEKMWFFSDTVGTVLFPRAASSADGSDVKTFIPVVFRSIMMVDFILVLVLYFTGEFIINLLYSARFAMSVEPFKILLLGAFSLSGFKILESDFKGRGKPGLITLTVGISSLVNIVLSFALIPVCGIIGAAWALTISYVFALLMGLTIYVNVSGNSLRDMIFIKRSDVTIYSGFAKIIISKISDKLFLGGVFQKPKQ